MPEDPNTWQYRVWRIVDSRPFEYFIMLLIALNTLILTMKVSYGIDGEEEFKSFLMSLMTAKNYNQSEFKVLKTRVNARVQLVRRREIAEAGHCGWQSCIS